MMKINLISFALIYVVLFGLSGCGGPDQPQGVAKQKFRSADPAQGIMSEIDLFKKISIDEAMSEKGIPQKAIDKFQAMKERGEFVLLERAAESIIREAMIKAPVAMTAKSRYVRNSQDLVQPSLSTLKNPLPFGYPEEPITAVEYRQGKVDFIQLGVDHFRNKQFRKFDKKDQAIVADYLDRILDVSLNQLDKSIRLKHVEEGQALLKRFAPTLLKEPMFNLCLAMAENLAERQQEARFRLQKVIKNFSVDDYPTRLPVYTIRLLYSMRFNIGAATDVTTFKHWLTRDFRARGTQERYALVEVEEYIQRSLARKDWPALNELVEILKSDESLPKWFSKMALAEYQAQLGYFHRGPGYIDKVTDEGWKKLAHHSKLAHKYYEQALEINPIFPEAAVGLIGISRLGYSDQDQSHWFEKAIEHEFDFQSAYNMRIYGLLPRWGGSADEMLDFAKAQAAKAQYESGVPYVLVKTLFMLRDAGILDADEYDKLLADRELNDAIVTSLKGLVDHNQHFLLNGRVRDKKFLQTMLALFLIRGSRPNESERVILEMAGDYSTVAVKLFGTRFINSFKYISTMATAFSAEYGEEARELHRMVSGNVEDRVEKIDEIEALVASIVVSDESGGDFFTRELNRVRQEKAFLDGEVVAIEFTPKMEIWQTADDQQLKYQSKESAIFDNRQGDQFNRFAYSGTFPGPKMIEMTLTFLDDSPQGKQFAPGFAVGWTGREYFNLGFSLTRKSMRRFGGKNPAKVGYLRMESKNGRHVDYPFPYKSKILRIRTLVNDVWAEVYINGQFRYRLLTPREHAPLGGFTLMPNRFGKGNGHVEFSDISIQRWKNSTPTTNSSEDLIEYYQGKLDSGSQDIWDRFWLAQALHANKQLDEALPHYLQAVKEGVNRQIAGFYIGDLLDRQGKRREAFEWYLKSAAGTEDGGIGNMMYAAFDAEGTPVAQSAYRAIWLHRTCGFKTEFAKVLTSRASVYGVDSRIANNLSVFLPERNKDRDGRNFALGHLNSHFEKLPYPAQVAYAPIKEIIERDGFYQADPEDEPLYLKFPTQFTLPLTARRAP